MKGYLMDEYKVFQEWFHTQLDDNKNDPDKAMSYHRSYFLLLDCWLNCHKVMKEHYGLD